MNKFLCFLTGGHKYDDDNMIVTEDAKRSVYAIYNYCIKCGCTHYTYIDATKLKDLFYRSRK